MAEFGSPVAMPDVNPSRAIQTLSGLLSLKQQQQELARGATALQGEQQTQRQRAGIADFMSKFDITKHTGGDGTLSLDDAFSDPELRKAAGDQFPQVAQQLVAIKQGQLQAKSSLAGLNQELRNQFLQTVGSLRTDPDVVADNEAGRIKVQQAMGNFAESGGPDAARVAQVYGPMVEHVPKEKLAQALSIAQQQGMDVATQAGRQAPTLADTGPKLTNVNPQAAPLDLKKDIPPGFSTFQDQAGNTWAVNPQTPGSAILVGHGKGGGAPAAPPVMAPGGVESAVSSAKNDEQLYTAIKGIADRAPITKNILQSIQTLADTTKTGAGSKQIATAESVIGQYIPGLKGAADDATKRQLIGKYAQQLLLQAYEANGASTDAAQAHVTAAFPDPDNMTPDAIKKAAKLIQAQTQIAQARASVAEKYRAEHGGSSQGLRAVDSAFTQNVDPRAFEFMGLPAAERAKWLQEQFGADNAARQKFADQLSLIDHYGGFSYAK